MATLTIKNIPENLYNTLKDQAEKHRRSLNSEIIVSLEQAVKCAHPDIRNILKEAQYFRNKTTKIKLTEAKLAAAKNKGRK